MNRIAASFQFLLPFVVLLMFTTVAFGGKEQDRAKARSLFESGTVHYNLGELDAALADFRAAYRVLPDPVFIFNIAQCLRRLDKPAQAADFYRTYRREAPDAPNRREVDQLIEEMDRAVVERRERQPPTGLEALKPSADEANPRPAGASAKAASGPATLAATAAPGPRRVPLYKKWWLWTGVGVVAVGIGVGLGVGLGASRSSGTVFTPEMIP